MKEFEGLAGAENYAARTSKTERKTIYVFKQEVLNKGIVYFAYENKDLAKGKLISTFKNGERV